MELGRRFISGCRPIRLRSLLEWSESEIIVPDGPFQGERFRADRQPFARLLFDEIDSGRWTTVAITGPSQTGKSLVGYVIPGLYHLFEIGETVICGLPDMAMAADKWAEDFLPAIEASRYRDLLPKSGPGSRGGKHVEAVRFRNGATLRFMSGGGSDKKRSAFTARVLLLTEVDGLAVTSANSVEADKTKQLVARTRAYGDRARVYKECTVSTDRGHIWQAYQAGTASRLAMPCHDCGSWVTPDREHLMGWQDAEDELAAIDGAHLVCPECKAAWTEAQRVSANRRAVLVHRGQEVSAGGVVTGDLPRTRTLGFRWTATNNMLNPIASVGAEEWHAARSIDADNAEKELRQFVWAIPHEPKNREVLAMSVQELARRQAPSPKSVVPKWATVLALGVDQGQYLNHWVLMAADQKLTRIVVVDYGVEEVHSRQYDLDHALELALQLIAAMADDRGWPDENGEPRHPDMVMYDAGWKPKPVYRHCRQNRPRHWPCKGFGLKQYGGGKYHRPKTTGAVVTQIFEGYHVSRLDHSEMGRVSLYEHDSDRGKAIIQDRLSIPIEEGGAILLPQVERFGEHTSFAKHILAEQLIEEDGVQKWVPTPGHGGHNHWLDASWLAMLGLLRVSSKPRGRRTRVTGSWAA